MSLTLYFHPLSSFCQKALIGLYELEVPFEKCVVDLGNEAERAALMKLWPLGKFPVLRDGARERVVAESTIILEYIDRFHSRNARLIPRDEDAAMACREAERFWDLHVNVPMQKVVTDKLRPDGQHDAFGVARARAHLATAYAIAEERLRSGEWARDAFTMADCAAAPALLYAREVLPLDGYPSLAKYFERLRARPSVARVFEEARPFWGDFPGGGET